jgi:hypothetical protein
VISEFQRWKLEADFQQLLLDYRVRYIAQVRDSEFDVPTLGPEVRMLARVLGSAIVDAPELRADLVNLLQQYQDEIAAGNAFSEESIAVEALLHHSHTEQPDQLVYVGQLADTSSKILKDRGSRGRLEPKSLGWILRNALGIIPKRNGKGFAIRVSEEVRRRIHQLAHEFQISTTDEMASTCSYCEHIATSDGDGKFETGLKKTESAA